MKLINILLKCISGLLMVIAIGGYLTSPFFGLPVSAFFLVFSVLVFCVSCNTAANPFQGDIFCNLLLIAFIIFNVPGYLWYYCGTKVLSNTDSSNMGVFLLLVRPSLLVLFVFFIIYLLIHLCVRSSDLYRARLILLIVLALACILKSFIYGPSEGFFLKGMAKTVTKQTDTSSILKWLPLHQIPSKEPEIPRKLLLFEGCWTSSCSCYATTRICQKVF